MQNLGNGAAEGGSPATAQRGHRRQPPGPQRANTSAVRPPHRSLRGDGIAGVTSPPKAAHAPAVQLSDITPTPRCPVMRHLKPLPGSSMSLWERIRLLASGPDLLHDPSASNGLPFVMSSFMLQPALLVADLQAARELLAEEGRAVTVGYPESVVQLTGRNAIINAADQEQHRVLRRLINQVLRQDAVDAAVPQIQELVVSYFDRWADEAAAGRTVKAYPEMKKMAFEVIARLLVEGLDDATIKTMFGLFQQWLDSFFTLPPLMVDAPPFPYHNAMNARRTLIKILSEQVTRLRKTLAAAAPVASSSTARADHHGQAHQGAANSTSGAGAGACAGSSEGSAAARSTPPQAPASTCTSSTSSASSSNPYGTILERMVLARDEDGRGLSDEEILDNLINIFFAGHDTSASSMTSMLQILAQHPHVMERLREEQRAVVAAHGEQLTGEALRCMPYAEATMRELFRYRVIIPAVLRTTREETELQGHAVPKGLMVSIGLATMIKTDPRFSNATAELAPECFAPERFLSEEGRRQGTQVPFGIGSRTCPGMALAQAELMVMLAVLARGYEFTADWKTGFSMFPMPRPKNDLPVYFYKINH